MLVIRGHLLERALLAWLSLAVLGVSAGRGLTDSSLHELPAAAPRSEDLKRRLEAGLEARGESYQPRTEHLRSDGGPKFLNRLILEESPYLLQHAHNPVDWYPWGEEAFERAKREGKAVFLSIGYSTCHWCHVMERESFDNVEIARLMNELFVNIKVDREQRPDIDTLYMTAVQVTGKRGGWPLSSFLTPDARPFFGATYFPPESFVQLLGQVAAAWRDRRAEVEASAGQLHRMVEQAVSAGGASAEIGHDAVEQAITSLLERIDPELGGFGAAPKFPHEPELLLMLQAYGRFEVDWATGDGDSSHRERGQQLAQAIQLTLRAMAQGGIYDQIGGGFHRYSTDAEFLVPHFEKMLYNQAHLARVYSAGYRWFGAPAYERVVRQTLDYLLREMRSTEGLFYSATDADSTNQAGESEEGAFFVWTPLELRRALSEEDAQLARELFGVTAEGNFEGRNILFLQRSMEQLAEHRKIELEDLHDRVDRIRAALREERAKRPPPLRDDKILTSWNAMTIVAFAEAAEALADPGYAKVAVETADELWRSARRAAGRLWRVTLDGKPSIPGLQEDSAYLAQALLAVYDLTGDRTWLERAVEVTDGMYEQFWDEASGGFFMSADGANSESGDPLMIARPKDTTDGAIPSGNSVAVRALVHLAARTGDPKYRRWAERSVSSLAAPLARYPAGFSYLLMGFDDLERGELGGRAYAGGGAVRITARVAAEPPSGSERPSLDIGLDIGIGIDIDIEEGWHINAHRPLSDELIPTEVDLPAGSAWRLIAQDYPAPERVVLSAREGSSATDGTEALIYQGRVSITGRLRWREGSGAEPARNNRRVALPVRVRLQACNDRLCLAPEDVSLEPFLSVPGESGR